MSFWFSSNDCLAPLGISTAYPVLGRPKGPSACRGNAFGFARPSEQRGLGEPLRLRRRFRGGHLGPPARVRRVAEVARQLAPPAPHEGAQSLALLLGRVGPARIQAFVVRHE